MNKKIIKNIKGVTLVALVVTIIVLLILAGVAINLAIGNNGLFTRAKNAAEKWQEASDTEKGQLDEFEKLYDNTIKDLNIGNTSGGDGTGDGEGDDDKTKEELEKIIEELKSKQATGNAGAEDVLEGKTFSNSDAIDVAGTMLNRGAVIKKINPGDSYTIPEGYHNGSGKVTANLANISASYSFSRIWQETGITNSTTVSIPAKSGYQHAFVSISVHADSYSGSGASSGLTIDFSNFTNNGTLTKNNGEASRYGYINFKSGVAYSARIHDDVNAARQHISGVIVYIK